jgi:hypothetical protein
MALDITKQNEFLESIDCEKNENGQFIYESDNGASRISLAYILIEYEQWCESHNASTSDEALPIADVGGNEVALTCDCVKPSGGLYYKKGQPHCMTCLMPKSCL